MDGSGLRTLSEERHTQVDAVLARFFSLANIPGTLRDELSPVADAVLGRTK